MATTIGTNSLSITLDRSDVKAVAHALSDVKNGARTAIMRAVNKGLTGGKTDMARATGKILNIKQKRIKKDITVYKANKFELSGKISSQGKPVNLIQFGARQTKKGVSYKIWKDKPRTTVKGMFIFVGRGKSGKGTHKLVGWRKKTPKNAAYIGTKKKTRPDESYASMPRKYRYPIEARYGPRIQDITSRPEVIKEVETAAGDRMNKELAHQVQHILDKHKAKLRG